MWRSCASAASGASYSVTFTRKLLTPDAKQIIKNKLKLIMPRNKLNDFDTFRSNDRMIWIYSE